MYEGLICLVQGESDVEYKDHEKTVETVEKCYSRVEVISVMDSMVSYCKFFGWKFFFWPVIINRCLRKMLLLCNLNFYQKILQLLIYFEIGLMLLFV